MTILHNPTQADYERLFPDVDGFLLQQFRDLMSQVLAQTSIIEESGVPTSAASKHQWYFDTATSKYYRNTDGGTTWVALN